MAMVPRLRVPAAIAAGVLLLFGAYARSGVAVAGALTVQLLASDRATETPVANSEFLPGADATAAEAFTGTLRIAQAVMQTSPALRDPLVGGRDARLFPAITLSFFADDGVLVPVQRGEMVAETGAVRAASYWRVIPQFGRVWKQAGDGDWSRAAFPLMLVNDTENHAHQGVATKPLLSRRGGGVGRGLSRRPPRVA